MISLIGSGDDHQQTGTDRRAGPPVGWALLAFAGTIAALVGVAAAGATGRLDLPMGPSSQYGMVAVTTFAIAGGLAAYRAVSVRNPWAGLIAIALFGPGAAWSWATFVASRPSALATELVVPAACGLAVVLVAKGLGPVRWLEIFGGLGALALGVAAALVRHDPTVATANVVPALLVAVAGMTCVYGLLVDLEVAEHRSLTELIESRRQVQEEVDRVEGLLHDLRSGLLAIEAAIGTFDDELAVPLRSEAARLRRLTLTGHRTISPFDLADRVAAMVEARRRGGVEVVLQSPPSFETWGEESEVLAIVDNLLANAERHGSPGPIEVLIEPAGSVGRLSVTNPGHLPTDDPDALFLPGITTHPDGRGLGLARARMLAGINGGDLRIGPADEGRVSFVLSLRCGPETAVA